jgi:hypothetical protein
MPRRARTISAHLTSLFLVVSNSSAVDTVRQSLDADSLRWFGWLIKASILVGIGVALEAPEATIALKRWYRLRRGKDVEPANENSLVIPIAYLGLLLVVASVAGEGIFEFLSSRSETALRGHDEQILGETQKQAAETYERAAGAMREAESAKLDAEDAKLRAQGASDKTDQEAKKREELGIKVEGRELTEKQQKDIGAVCANLYTYGSKKRILVRSYGMDNEGEDLAKEISAALASAHLYNAINTGDIQTGVLDTGC